MKKKIHIITGGTAAPIDSHLSLAAPFLGTVGEKIAELCQERFGQKMEVCLCKADIKTTNEKVWAFLASLIEDMTTKIIFMPVGLVDFYVEDCGYGRLPSDQMHTLTLKPQPKLLPLIRKKRKDIFLVGFKQTYESNPEIAYQKALKLLKESSCNLVLMTNTLRRETSIVVPEESEYHRSEDRNLVLRELVDMVWHRTHLTFTRSTVVDGELVDWRGADVPESLRTVVEYCINQGAYVAGPTGVTVGHFACRIGENEFLTSIRRTNFNEMTHLVRVRTDGPDNVIAYGARPSVGGQSQRIVFAEHENFDCIVHFHCPLRQGSLVPTVSQREFECGSHECGANTSRGLKEIVPGIWAVYLDKHGPNILFNKDIHPAKVIQFIEANFDLTRKTDGY